jgi:steroid 5-alpha reductase family enzyme
MAVVMTAAFITQTRTGQGGWADAFWSFGLGAAGVLVSLYPLNGSAPEPRQLLVAALIAIWGTRLGVHIAKRAARESEDARYARLRAKWADAFAVRMYGFLMLQAGAASVLVLGVLVAARNPVAGLALQDALATLIFLTAVIGETVADRQLAAFKSNPDNKGKICDTGLWAWSRHPNYFFEWLGWCAWPVFAINLSGDWHWGWVALIPPAYIYWLLNSVSGVPLVEAHMQRTRPQAFAAYAARTSRFFLRPSKS